MFSSSSSFAILFFIIITFNYSPQILNAKPLVAPLIPGQDSIPEETPEEKFLRSDKDHDNRLSFDEFLHTDLPYDRIKKDEFDSLDKNRDGLVSREEYDEYWQQQKEKSINRRARYFGKIYEDFDENFDMKLSEDEVKQILADRFLLKPKSNFHQIFVQFDRNGDGGLDIHEYINFDKNMPFEELQTIDDDEHIKATTKHDKMPLQKANNPN